MHPFAVGSLLLNTLNLLLNESTTGNTKNVNLEKVYEQILTLYIYIVIYIYIVLLFMEYCDLCINE